MLNLEIFSKLEYILVMQDICIYILSVKLSLLQNIQHYPFHYLYIFDA